MVKKMLFAVAILALAVLGPGAGLLEAAPIGPPMPPYCVEGIPCTNTGQCGYNYGMYLGACFHGRCYCR
jgi:hypothetical protein